jgi:class 3 adenylate cyclase/tetratricopeptide (TPR) repeat protein
MCPRCGTANADGAKFCNECAEPLGRAPASTVVEERKVVSVLFCDLVGFTAASERSDPEDVRARLRPYHGRLRRELERYGGTVEKFVGDAVMAVFGAPLAHEDDAERAVRAALATLDAIRDLNQNDSELDLQVRIGINTGEAVVSVGAQPERGEGIVAGDVVNTAARIQGVAPVDAVAVSEQTYRATSRVFEYEPLPQAAVKGKGQPLVLWRPVTAKARYGSDVTREFNTPFVGRELERPLLIATFERAAQQRSLQSVTVVGEPGVGKSRLIGELFRYIHGKPEIIRWRQGRCLPYGEGITFWALGEIVKAEAGILESDSAELAAAKLDAAVAPAEPERAWMVQRLAPLIGIEATSTAERQELFTAWRLFLEGLATSRPTVLVLEDLHWADEALLAFLEYLAEWSHGVPILVVCAARPELYERRPGWGAGQRNAQTINLAPLSDEETSELVRYLSRGVLAGHELERAVLDRAGGNPLYAEEFVRLLTDRGLDLQAATADSVALPDTVQALIAARLDTLTVDRKSLLQDAAVIGKVFWLGALAQVSGRDADDVVQALHELVRKELIRPSRSSSMEGETEYSFWHLLIRDVAYGQIARAERSRRHRAVAEWIEQRAGERVEDLAEVLAFHYLQALELVEAVGDTRAAAELAPPARRFAALAGERALGLDTAQAEARLARALELTPGDDPERPHLLVRWADAASQAGRLREASARLDEALQILRARAEFEGAATALRLRSRVALRLGEAAHVDFAAEAVAMLESSQNTRALIDAYGQLANAQAINGSYHAAVATAERALTLARQRGEPTPARALGYRGYARAHLGDEDGLDDLEEALKLFMEAEAARDAAAMQNNIALLQYPRTGPAEALARFDEGVEYCRRRGLLEPAGVLESNCPGLLLELGRGDEALARASTLAAVLELRGDSSLIEVRAVQLALSTARGKPEPAVEAAALITSARESGQPELVVLAFASAAAALVPDAPGRACELLGELERMPGSHETPYYARELGTMTRTAIAAGDVSIAARLAGALEPQNPLNAHALATANAELAEQARDLELAASLYAEAARGWRHFGNVPEHAYALLGRGRCLHALGDSKATAVLLESRELFATLGYAAADDAEALLARAIPSAP